MHDDDVWCLCARREGICHERKENRVTMSKMQTKRETNKKHETSIHVAGATRRATVSAQVMWLWARELLQAVERRRLSSGRRWVRVGHDLAPSMS